MSQFPQQESPESKLREMPRPVLGYSAPLKAGMRMRRVAMQQRVIIFCILAEIFIFVSQIMPINVVGWRLWTLTSWTYWPVAVIAAIFLSILATSLYNMVGGIVLGILSLVPVLGLFIMLIVNGKATDTLRKRGIRVGLLGADPSTIPIDGGP